MRTTPIPLLLIAALASGCLETRPGAVQPQAIVGDVRGEAASPRPSPLHAETDASETADAEPETTEVAADPACTGSGLTWALLEHRDDFGIDHVGCWARDGGCEPYVGDTPCVEARPLLCLRPGSEPNPGIETSYYHGWSGGTVAVTEPIVGCSLTSWSLADRQCAERFGPEWRMAEFHDGQGGWAWWGVGAIETSSRFWVAIDDQVANCWNGR